MTLYLEKFKNLYDVERTRKPVNKTVKMRLQRNEKPDNWPPEFLKEIYSSFPDYMLQQYPNPNLFYEKLARFLGVPEDKVLVASGIDESIKSLLLLCCDSGDKIVYTPGYAMYEVYARIFGIDPIAIEYDPTRFTGPQDIIEKTPKDAKALFIPNPSQPVENCIDLDQLREIAAYCRDNDILFAVDEAYQFFGAPDAIPLIDEFDNMLVLRTFSKAFGGASLRLGYVVGSEKALKPLAAFRLAHEANAFSLHIGSMLLDNFDTFVKGNIDDVCMGRDYLRQTFIENGFPAWGNVGNFVLVDLGTKERLDAVVGGLREKGIHIRGGLPRSLESQALVTCGGSNLMKNFFEEFLDTVKDN